MMSLQHETPEHGRTKVKPTPPEKEDSQLDDTKVRLLTIVHSYFFIYFTVSLILLSAISFGCKSISFTIGWPNTNMGNCWQIRDYLDYSSQYAGLVGAILAAVGITANNSSYYSELLTKHLSRQWTSIILAALQLANVCITASIFMLIFKVKNKDAIPLVIGLGFNLITIFSPLMFIFLAQRLVRKNIKKRLEVINSDVIKLEKGFPELKSTEATPALQQEGPHNDTPPGGNPFGFMERIQRKSNLKSIPYRMAVVFFLAIPVGSAIFITQSFYGHDYPCKQTIVAITGTSIASLSVALPCLILLGLTRFIYAEFLLQKVHKWLLIIIHLTLFLYVEALILMTVWLGIIAHTSNPYEIGEKIALLVLFTLSFIVSTLSVCCERLNWDGVFYPKQKFAQQMRARLYSEKRNLDRLYNSNPE